MSDEGKDQTVSILSYIFFIGIIWYFADDDVRGREKPKFHVKQSLNLIIISFVATTVLTVIPILGWMVLPLAQIAFFVLWIIGLVNAVNQKQNEIPIIGGFAEKYLNF